MTAQKGNQNMGDKIEKEAENLIRDFVDDGYSLGEIWSICTKAIEKMSNKK